MTTTPHSVAAGILTLGMTLFTGFGQTLMAETIAVPPMPDSIQVPSGNTLFLKAQATGTQNYICAPSPTGFAWKFFGPQATLFVTIKWFSGDIRQQVTTHFLSPNPAEGGLARATWQGSLDTSAVWGKAIAQSNDPNFVAPGAIPWLLVQAVGSRPGPTGGELLTPTTYIHRLNTAGGVAPSTGCSEATDGSFVLVPYTTDYYFYKASRSR
jgi:hypothetical protein